MIENIKLITYTKVVSVIANLEGEFDMEIVMRRMSGSYCSSDIINSFKKLVEIGFIREIPTPEGTVTQHRKFRRWGRYD